MKPSTRCISGICAALLIGIMTGQGVALAARPLAAFKLGLPTLTASDGGSVFRGDAAFVARRAGFGRRVVAHRASSSECQCPRRVTQSRSSRP
jgi:hypothetical protein